MNNLISTANIGDYVRIINPKIKSDDSRLFLDGRVIGKTLNFMIFWQYEIQTNQGVKTCIEGDFIYYRTGIF